MITGYLCLPTPAGEKSKPYILHYLDHFPTKAGVGNRLDHKIADSKGSFVRLISRSFRHLIVLVPRSQQRFQCSLWFLMIWNISDGWCIWIVCVIWVTNFMRSIPYGLTWHLHHAAVSGSWGYVSQSRISRCGDIFNSRTLGWRIVEPFNWDLADIPRNSCFGP